MTPKILPFVVHKLKSSETMLFKLTLACNSTSSHRRRVRTYSHFTPSCLCCTQRELMSHSRYYLDHESVRAIVAMGKNAIPLIMAEYTKHPNERYHEALHEIVFGVRSGAASVHFQRNENQATCAAIASQLG